MVKQDTILILGAAGIGGYFLYKSGFFKGLTGISEGAGEAVSGIGEGITTVSGDIGQVTSNIADFLNPLGATGTWLSQLISNAQSSSLRESVQATSTDEAAYNLNAQALAKIQAEKETSTATQASLRSDKIQTTGTNIVGAVTAPINAWSSAVQVVSKYNPVSLITNWISSQNKSKSLKTSITGSAISTNKSSSSRNLKTTKITSTNRNLLLERLGYYGMSTPEGIVYTKPTVIGTFK